MVIWVDCDDVLSQTIDFLLNSPYFTARNIKIWDITSYNLYEISSLGLSYQQAVKVFGDMFSSPDYLKMKPVDGAKEWLERLKKGDNKLILITGRSDIRREKTIEWLERYWLDLFDDYIFANENTDQAKSKSEICLENGVELMIEDRISICQELAGVGIPSFLIDCPWNQWEVEDLIRRVKSWNEIM